MALFTQDEHKQIEVAVAEAEKRTSVEFVVAEVPRSARYGGYQAAGAALATFTLSTLAYLFVPELPEAWLLSLQPLVAGLCFWISGLPPMLRFLIPDAEEQRAVDERARALFFEFEVASTRQRTGVLILVSKLERRVELLHDVALRGAVPADQWEKWANELAARIRERRGVLGIETLVQQLTDLLATRFPRAVDGDAGLPNAVRRPSLDS